MLFAFCRFTEYWRATAAKHQGCNVCKDVMIPCGFVCLACVHVRVLFVCVCSCPWVTADRNGCKDQSRLIFNSFSATNFSVQHFWSRNVHFYSTPSFKNTHSHSHILHCVENNKQHCSFSLLGSV